MRGPSAIDKEFIGMAAERHGQLNGESQWVLVQCVGPHAVMQEIIEGGNENGMGVEVVRIRPCEDDCCGARLLVGKLLLLIALHCWMVYLSCLVCVRNYLRFGGLARLVGLCLRLCAEGWLTGGV